MIHTSSDLLYVDALYEAYGKVSTGSPDMSNSRWIPMLNSGVSGTAVGTANTTLGKMASMPIRAFWRKLTIVPA